MTAPQTWPIHPAAADLFTAMAGDELKQLADDIAQHGLHEPVWLWRDRAGQVWLLDGRNRVAACEIARVAVTHRWYEGDDPIAFVTSENVKRRQLTAGQLATIAIKAEGLYERFAAEAKERQREHGGTAPGKPPESLVADRPQVKTRDKAAAATGAKSRNVGKAKRIRDRAPDLFDKVDKGEMPIDRADRVIRNREAEQRQAERAKAEAAAAGTVATIDVRLGDFRDVLADLTNVDAIITDPPYGKKFLPLLGDLAKWSDKVLAPDGVMAVLIGQTYLPDVYLLLGAGRPYRWTACFLGNANRSYQCHARKVKSNWKPLLIYGGGSDWFVDVIRGGGGDAAAKTLHKWGQEYVGFHQVIERLTERGQTVVDPFLGSATTALAGHALGRHVIGCDIDEQAVATARARLR
jgi:ParB-like chromosome segregation protein Spo0J